MSDCLLTISVVTPSLNKCQFIEDAIRSVLIQEGNFLIDFVIMDGGSPDNTLEIIRKYDRMIESEDVPVKCKGISLSTVSDRLIEDIPSIVSPEKEQQFLKNNKDIIFHVNT